MATTFAPLRGMGAEARLAHIEEFLTRYGGGAPASGGSGGGGTVAVGADPARLSAYTAVGPFVWDDISALGSGGTYTELEFGDQATGGAAGGVPLFTNGELVAITATLSSAVAAGTVTVRPVVYTPDNGTGSLGSGSPATELALEFDTNEISLYLTAEGVTLEPGDELRVEATRSGSVGTRDLVVMLWLRLDEV